MSLYLFYGRDGNGGIGFCSLFKYLILTTSEILGNWINERERHKKYEIFFFFRFKLNENLFITREKRNKKNFRKYLQNHLIISHLYCIWFLIGLLNIKLTVQIPGQTSPFK